MKEGKPLNHVISEVYMANLLRFDANGYLNLVIQKDFETEDKKIIPKTAESDY